MPPPLTISSSTNSLSAATIAARRAASSLRRAPLHEADRGAAQPPPRRPVGDAGDLPLVGHQRVEFDLRPPLDLPRQRHRLLDRPHRRALRPDLDPPAQRPPAGVDVDADPDRRRAAAQHRLDRLQVLDAVDHHDRRFVGAGDRAQRQLLQRPEVGGRVGEQQVVEALLGQPQGLRQRVGHQPGEAAVAPQRRLDQRPAAQALGRDPDRLAARPGQHRVRVRPHRVEVDEGERSLDLGEELLVSLVGLVGRRHHPRQTSRAVPGQVPTIGRRARETGRDLPGEVAEWLKALAC